MTKFLTFLKAAWSTGALFPLATGILLLLLFHQCSKNVALEDTLKTSTELVQLQADQNIAVAKHAVDLTNQVSQLTKQSADTAASLKTTQDELDKLKIKYQTVMTEHASTGPLIVKMPDNRPSGCVVSGGDKVSIEVGQLILKTEAGNYVIAGSAWVEKEGAQLFGGPFDPKRVDVSVLDNLGPKIETRSSWSVGLTAIVTTATKPMFGPSGTLHLLKDRLELGGAAGMGMDAGFIQGSLHYRW